jgi:hypothetical protein
LIRSGFLKKPKILKKVAETRNPVVRLEKPQTVTVEPVMSWFSYFQNLIYFFLVNKISLAITQENKKSHHLFRFEKIIDQYRKFSKIKKKEKKTNPAAFSSKKSVITHSSSSSSSSSRSSRFAVSFSFFLIVFLCSHFAVCLFPFFPLLQFLFFSIFCLLIFVYFLVYVQLMSLLIYCLLVGLCVNFTDTSHESLFFKFQFIFFILFFANHFNSSYCVI